MALFLVMMSQHLNAQQLQSCDLNLNKVNPMLSNGVKTSQLPLNDNEYWWGYFDGSFGNTMNIGMGGNTVIPQYYNTATCIPAGTKDMKGKSINGIRFTFPSPKNITDVKIWISTTLPSSAEKADICWQSVDKITGFNMDDQFNEVRFEKPYDIDDTKDTYIGYSFVVNKDEGQFDQYPVFTSGMQAHPKGLIVKVGADGDWNDYEEFGFGDLAVLMLMGGGNFESNSVSISNKFNDIASAKGAELLIPVEVKNMGGNGFTSLGITVDIAGNKQEIIVTPDSKVSGISTKYNFEIKTIAPSESGTYPVKITVDKVNGEANVCTKNVSEGNLLVISRIVDRKVLFEEFTATWCGFCPRGAVGLEKAVQVYGNKVVPVAVHYQDEMDCTDYTALIKATVGGFPGSHINRTFMDVDPYFGKTGSKMFGVGELIDECLAEIPVAEIKAEATVEDDIITVKTDVKYLFSGDVACAVGYILTANGLENEAWWQGNNYSGAKGFEDEPLFDKWVEADHKAKDVVYNDVVISAVGIEKGYNPTVMTKAVEEESNIHEVQFKLSDYPIIQDKSKLNVSVFIYDRKTGRIMNADRIAVDGTTGIDEVNADDSENTEIARYTIDGRRINGTERGINIVKYSNGSIKKVVVE